MNEEKKSAVIFDMDGLMFDTERVFIEAWDYAGEKTGIGKAGYMVHKTLGMNIAASYKIWKEEFGEKYDQEGLRKYSKEFLRDYYRNNRVPVKKGLYVLLDYLKEAGYRLAVASSSPQWEVESHLKDAGVFEYFEVIVSGDMVAHSKPDPEIYCSTCELLHVLPEQCYALEDSKSGLYSAYQAGCAPIMVPDLWQPDEVTKKFLAAICEDLEQVKEFIEKNTKSAQKTLYVTDLDGTLLNKNDRISAKSMEIINGLVEKGMLFTYATARSLVSASVVTQGLSVDIPVIAYNGALIVHPATGEVLSQVRFTGEEAKDVIAALTQYNISPLVYAYIQGVEKVSWIPERENEGIRHYLDKRQGDRRLHPVADKNALYQGDLFYFTCIGEREELQPVYDMFSSDKRFRCTLQQELYRPEYFCEIMPAQATKAKAVCRLKKLWGCDRIVSFGDAVNDIPMFEISDEAYAVGNAVPELKAAATGIIGSNEEDGVANWLKEHAAG